MITGKKLLVLANIETVQDVETGDRKKEVTGGKKLINTVELVGIQTAQLGQTQGFNLNYSVEVLRVHYNSEKYLYFDGDLYEIKTTSKAREKNKMLLNVQQSGDNEIKQAVERWLNG